MVVRSVKAVLALLLTVTLVAAFSLGTAAAATKAMEAAAPAASAVAGKVDLNSATQAELEKLPGVGPAAAKKIIAGRPYKTTADLAKSGIPAKTVEKISPLVTVGAAPAAVPKALPAAAPATLPAAVPKAAVPAAAPPAKVPAAAPAAAPAKAAKPTPPPAGKGMVWVNTESKIYHTEGSHWYGKTKTGSYMTEAEAVKAGYRPAKKGTAEK